MRVPPKATKPDAQGAANRRSTRLAIAIPITISGKDASGHTFKENSRTVIINKQGAKILTLHEITLNSELTVENRALGRAAQAIVVWVGNKASPKDPVEVGVQLSHAENIWGIEFPPDDWQEGPPMGPGGQRVESPAGPLPAAPSERIPSAVPAPAGPVAPPKPPESPRASAPPISVPTRPAAAPGVVEATAQVSVARLSKQTEEMLEEGARQFEQRLSKLTQQIGFQSQATLQEAANRQEEKIVQAIEQESAALEQRVQAARADLEAPLAKLQELQQAAQEELEKTQRNIQTASFATLQAAMEELNEKVRPELESTSASFVEETRRRIEDAAAAVVEVFHKQASARLALDELQRKLNDMLRGAQEQCGKSVLEAQQKGLKDFLDRIQKAGDEHLDSAARDLQRQAADTLLLLTDELKTSGKAAVEEMRRQLAALTRETLETISKDTRAAQLSAAALEAAGKATVEETREKLAFLSAETLETLTQEAKTLARDYPVHIRKTLQEFQDQRTRELEDHLQKALEKQRQAVLKQIQKVSEDAADQAVTQLRTKSDQVINEVADGFTKTLGERLQQRSEALVQDFQSRLEYAARSVHERSVKEIEGRIRELTLKQIEESDAELDKRAAENLELVTEQLKEKQEQTVEEATELFRNTIGQMFAALQLGPKKPPEGEGPKKRH
jgi:hypothetical protein